MNIKCQWFCTWNLHDQVLHKKHTTAMYHTTAGSTKKQNVSFNETDEKGFFCNEISN